jgi:hypothetical protein
MTPFFFYEKMKRDTFISIKFSKSVRYIFLSVSAFVPRGQPASVQMAVDKDGSFRVEGSH